LTVELEKLSLKLFNQALPINTLKIFAHYLDEYDYLHELVSNMGPKAAFSSKTSLYAQVNEKIQAYSIEYIGVRAVDPYRLHVGCGDFEIDNFAEFKETHVNKSPFIRVFSEDILEIF